MKNVFKLSVIIALAVIIGFTVIACGNGTTGGGGTPSDPTSVTYTSTDGTDTYKLVITKKGSRAAYDPQSGDGYVLTVTGTQSYKSTGTVKSASGGSVTLTKDGTDFTVTIANGEMTKITGTITSDDGNTKTAPGTVQQPDTGTNTDPALNGTWVRTMLAPTDDYYFKFSNGNYESFGVVKGDVNKPGINSIRRISDIKGTYTTEGEEITFTPTHMKTYDTDVDDNWYTKDEILSNGGYNDLNYTLDEYFEVFTLTYSFSYAIPVWLLLTTPSGVVNYTKK